MSDCCETTNTEDEVNLKKLPRKSNCPVNEQKYIEVDKKTILQHIKSPWQNKLEEEKYYFCDDPECDVVYFSLEGAVINKIELRTIVGKKDNSDESLVCYCFGVSKKNAKNNQELKNYVTQQTKEHNCACEVRNPSGRCCLKDFPQE